MSLRPKFKNLAHMLNLEAMAINLLCFLTKATKASKTTFWARKLIQFLDFFLLWPKNFRLLFCFFPTPGNPVHCIPSRLEPLVRMDHHLQRHLSPHAQHPDPGLRGREQHALPGQRHPLHGGRRGERGVSEGPDQYWNDLQPGVDGGHTGEVRHYSVLFKSTVGTGTFRKMIISLLFYLINLTKNGLFGTSFFGNFLKKVPSVLFTKALPTTINI